MLHRQLTLSSHGFLSLPSDRVGVLIAALLYQDTGALALLCHVRHDGVKQPRFSDLGNLHTADFGVLCAAGLRNGRDLET